MRCRASQRIARGDGQRNGLMQTLLPALLKIFVFCGFVTCAMGFYQQMMFYAAWRRDQYDQGRSVWSPRSSFALFSRNLSAQRRIRRQKLALVALAFLVFFALTMVTLEAMHRLGVTS
jgi:hypothetical protein